MSKPNCRPATLSDKTRWLCNEPVRNLKKIIHWSNNGPGPSFQIVPWAFFDPNGHLPSQEPQIQEGNQPLPDQSTDSKPSHDGPKTSESSPRLKDAEPSKAEDSSSESLQIPPSSLSPSDKPIALQTEQRTENKTAETTEPQAAPTVFAVASEEKPAPKPVPPLPASGDCDAESIISNPMENSSKEPHPSLNSGASGEPVVSHSADIASTLSPETTAISADTAVSVQSIDRPNSEGDSLALEVKKENSLLRLDQSLHSVAQGESTRDEQPLHKTAVSASNPRLPSEALNVAQSQSDSQKIAADDRKRPEKDESEQKRKATNESSVLHPLDERTSNHLIDSSTAFRDKPSAPTPLLDLGQTRNSTELSYLERLERLVVQLNYELGAATQKQSQQSPNEWMIQRMIDLNLRNLELQEKLASFQKQNVSGN